MSNPKPTRRQFARQVAALAVVPAVAGVEAAVAANPPPAPPQPQRPETPAQALLELVRLRYGRHLNEEQLRAVQDRIGRNVSNATVLRRTPLHNGDEPCFSFTADVP